MESQNIWQKLKQEKKPFFALAPMEEVTDTVFRRIVMKAGRPDIFFTEFTSCEGICSRGRKHVIHRFEHIPEERPLIAQIWGLKPECFEETAKLVQTMGFDGIDINMGCPVPDVVKRGACSGLIGNPTLAAELIEATKRGAGDLPVSVKTRIGLNEIDIEGWIGFILKQNVAALTVHMRTTAEQSKVPAHWELAKQVSDLRTKIAPQTVLIGNGDILSVTHGKLLAEQNNFDGIMVGRGIFHNPWMFSADPERVRSTKEKMQLMMDHVTLHKEQWQGIRNYHALKRFYKIYVNGFDGASELRDELMLTNNHDEFFGVMMKYERTLFAD